MNLKFPLLLSPMGHQTQFEKNGELSSAKGIHEQDVLGFFSTQEELALNT